MNVDTESPEWTIAWALRKHRKSIACVKPDMTELVAREIACELQRSNWRFFRIPPEPPAPGGSDPMREAVLRRRQEEREAFEKLLAAVLCAWRSRG